MPIKDKEKKLQYHRDYNKKNSKPLLLKKKIRRRKQRDFIWEAKSVPCADCGVKYHPWIMDFDHIKGVKRFNLNRLTKISASWETIKKEIEKCEVVCSNCHRNRTYLRIKLVR